MKHLRLYIAQLLALLVISCSDNPVVSYLHNEIQVTGSADLDSRTTFVQGEGVIETHWEVEDEIGLWTEEQSNMKYKAMNKGTTSTFQPAEHKKLNNEDGQTVYAYYPYKKATLEDEYISLPNFAEYEQDKFTPFMYSQGQVKDGKLNLQFKHLFAYLKIKISVQNIKDAFSSFRGANIKNGGMVLRSYGGQEPLATDNTFYNLKTNEYSGTFSDRVHISFGKDIDFDSDNVYTYLVPVLPISVFYTIGVGFFFNGSYQYDRYYVDLPDGGLKAGHVYNWDLTDSKEASDELYEALESFYVKTGGGQHWHGDNWLSDKPLHEWYGINKEMPLKYKTLRSLDLSDNVILRGPFPEEVAVFMETADYIDLSINYLTGPIPEKVKNHRKWSKLGWRMIRQFQTREGQLDLTNSNLYISDMNLDYLFEGDTQRPRTLHEFIKQNQLTQIFNLYDAADSFDDVLKVITGERINQHLDYQKKGLKTLIFCTSDYIKDNLKKKISKYYGELEGVEWVYGIAPINGCYYHNSYVFDNNCQLVYNANYNIGCPTWDNDWVHHKLSEFFRTQLGEPSEHPEFLLGSKSTDFSKDGEVFVIQEATQGKGINIVFIGEGYIDKEMEEDGLYERTMKEATEIFFSEEPYKSLRDRFNVYGVKVVSPNAGYIEGEHGINEDNAVCFDYFRKIPNSDKNPPMVSVIYRNFTWGEHMGRSHTYMYEDGSFVAYMYYGVDEAPILIHETGGHGFGLLLDEYVELGYETKTLPEEEKTYLDNVWAQYGWGANVDWRKDKATVKWAHFLNDDRYTKEGLGLYEGSYLYGRGAYRPTENSMMRYNNGPFNAPSREAIYKRIMKLSEGENWKYDYEEFVEFDEKNRKASSRSVVKPLTETEKKEYAKKHCPPTLIKGTWRDAIKNDNRNIVVPFR